VMSAVLFANDMRISPEIEVGGGHPPAAVL
jgi:hypothetical protein